MTPPYFLGEVPYRFPLVTVRSVLVINVRGNLINVILQVHPEHKSIETTVRPTSERLVHISLYAADNDTELSHRTGSLLNLKGSYPASEVITLLEWT